MFRSSTHILFKGDMNAVARYISRLLVDSPSNPGRTEKHQEQDHEDETDLLCASKNYQYRDPFFPDIFILKLSNDVYKICTLSGEIKYTCYVQEDEYEYNDFVCKMYEGDDDKPRRDIIGHWTIKIPIDSNNIETSVIVYLGKNKGQRLGYYGFLVLRLYLYLNPEKIGIRFPSKTKKWRDFLLRSSEWRDQYDYVFAYMLKQANIPFNVNTDGPKLFEKQTELFNKYGIIENSIGFNFQLPLKSTVQETSLDKFSRIFKSALEKTFTVKMLDRLFNYKLHDAFIGTLRIEIGAEFAGSVRYPVFTHRHCPEVLFKRIDNESYYVIETTTDLIKFRLVFKRKRNEQEMDVTVLDASGAEQIMVSVKDYPRDEGTNKVVVINKNMRQFEFLLMLVRIATHDYAPSMKETRAENE